MLAFKPVIILIFL